MSSKAPIKLPPDLDTAQKFLSLLCEDDNIVFQFFLDDKVKKEAMKNASKAEQGEFKGHFCASFSTASERLTQLNNEGCGIYIMANEGDGSNGRETKNVTRVRALFADLDGAPLSLIEECRIEPHIITETSPGRYHAFWMVDFCPLDRFTELQKAISYRFCSDQSVTDLPRVVRLPGFWHVKGKPFLSRILKTDPSQPYKLEDLILGLGLDKELEDLHGGDHKRLTPLGDVLIERIKPGDRHRTLLQYASRYTHGFRMSAAELHIMMQGINRAACDPPIDADDLRRIEKRAIKYAEEKIAKESEIDFSVLIERNKIAVTKTKQAIQVIPEWLLRPSGLVGELAEFMLATSIRPQPELALAAALCACGALFGRRVRSETNLRTNLYCISLINTGGGKDWPRQVIKKLFTAIDARDRASVENLASSSAIAEALGKTPSQVFLLDEFGRMLKSVSDPRAGAHLSEIPKELIQLYSSANCTYNAKSYADAKFNRVIEQPNVCLLATTVARHFYSSLTKEAIEDGLLNRFLIFRCEDPDPVIRKITNFDLPASLVEQFSAWEKTPYRSAGNLADVESAGEHLLPEPMVIPYVGNAEEAFDDLESDMRQVRADLRQEGLDGLFSRVQENAIKVALIVAVGRQRRQITVDDAEYACSLVRLLTNNTLEFVRRHVADNRIEANKNQVLSLIRAAGENGISGNDLCRKNRGLTKRERSEILDELESAGEIGKRQEVASGSGKRPRLIYYLQDGLTEIEKSVNDNEHHENAVN